MTTESETTSGITDEEKRLLETLTQGPKSHNQLRTALNLDTARYDAIRESLLQKEEVAPYRCRGGGLKLWVKEQDLPDVDESELAIVKTSLSNQKDRVTLEEEKSEKDLYPYVREWMLNSRGFGGVEIVADFRPDCRAQWEIPDLIGVDDNDCQVVLARCTEVTAVEVKLSFKVDAIW